MSVQDTVSREADNRVQNDIISINKFNGNKQRLAIKTLFSIYTKKETKRQKIAKKKKE